MNFDEFLKQATGITAGSCDTVVSYDYQRRLARKPRGRREGQEISVIRS
jgi:hypothetical protein